MPLAVRAADKVAVADALNDVRRFVAVCQYRIVRVADKFAPYRLCARTGHHMSVLSAALRRHEVVPFANFVHMRAFKVSAARALPYALARRQLFARGDVDLALYNAALALFVNAVADEKRHAVLEIKRGVYSALIDIYRVRPFAANVIGIDVKILMSGVVSSDHVKSAVVVADSRRENAARTVYFIQHDLIFTGEHITYLLPVDKVGAFKKWHSGGILKRTAYHVIFAISAANAGVGIKSLYYRVCILHKFFLQKSCISFIVT